MLPALPLKGVPQDGEGSQFPSGGPLAQAFSGPSEPLSTGARSPPAGRAGPQSATLGVGRAVPLPIEDSPLEGAPCWEASSGAPLRHLWVGWQRIPQRRDLPLDFLFWKMRFQFTWPVTPGAEGAPDHWALPWVLSPEASPRWEGASRGHMLVRGQHQGPASLSL